MKTALIGLGYFSQFHLRAWQAHPTAKLVAVADRDAARLDTVPGLPGYTDPLEMIAAVSPDILDLVVPPTAQADLIRAALHPGRTLICQKPFCTSINEAQTIVEEAEAANTTLVIHENFRFQPWYRRIKEILQRDQLGPVFGAQFALRPGDGRGADAYLARQPGFQAMPRFLVQETAVHLIDTFQWLFGEVTSVYADLRRLNPAIKGEDAGHLVLTHAGGARSIFDGNRLSDHIAEDPRRTMGEMRIETEQATLRLDGDGMLWRRDFGAQSEIPVPILRPVDFSQFGGGCVAALIGHVVDKVAQGKAPENTAREYLSVLRLVEAAYQSDAEGRRVEL